MFRADRNDADLDGAEPEREGALEVLDQYADEALKGAENGAVHHNRPTEGSVPVHIFHIEIKRQLEIKLDRAHLPLAAEAVLHLKVNLRTVECAVPFIDLIISFAVHVVQNPLQGSFRLIPESYIAHKIFRPRGQLRPVSQSERTIDFIRDTHDIMDFFFNLILRDQVMGVILAEQLDTEEAVQLTGFFFPVYYIHCIETDRQVLIAVLLPLVHLDGVRAVHRFDSPVILTVFLDAEHVRPVMSPVPARLPDLLIVDHGSGNLRIAVNFVDSSPVIQKGVIQLPAPREPVGHAGCRGIEHEQIQLRPELLVVALHRFLHEIQMGLQLLLVRERIDIDALQLVIVLVALPVGAGNGFDLKCGAHQFLRIVDMRPAAQIRKIVTGLVNGNRLVIRELNNRLRLVFLVLKKLQGFLFGYLDPLPVFLSLQDLPHFVLNRGKIILIQRARQHEIIIKPVRNLRADRILYIFRSEQLNHRFCQHMSQ